jgi:hypothetical protein
LHCQNDSTSALAAKPALLDCERPTVAVLSLPNFDTVARVPWEQGHNRKEAEYKAHDGCQSDGIKDPSHSALILAKLLCETFTAIRVVSSPVLAGGQLRGWGK